MSGRDQVCSILQVAMLLCCVLPYTVAMTQSDWLVRNRESMTFESKSARQHSRTLFEKSVHVHKKPELPAHPIPDECKTALFAAPGCGDNPLVKACLDSGNDSHDACEELSEIDLPEACFTENIRKACAEDPEFQEDPQLPNHTIPEDCANAIKSVPDCIASPHVQACLASGNDGSEACEKLMFEIGPPEACFASEAIEKACSEDDEFEDHESSSGYMCFKKDSKICSNRLFKKMEAPRAEVEKKCDETKACVMYEYFEHHQYGYLCTKTALMNGDNIKENTFCEKVGPGEAPVVVPVQSTANATKSTNAMNTSEDAA